MSFAVDPAHDIARQVGHALEDEAAQPLTEVQRARPEGCDYFSELEASISEWSFGYGVAWALARMRDPLLGSSATGRIAEQAVRDAWRLVQRPVMDGADGRGPRPARPGRGRRAAGPSAADADASPRASQYGDSWARWRAARPRRPPPGDAG